MQPATAGRQISITPAAYYSIILPCAAPMQPLLLLLLPLVLCMVLLQVW